MFKFKMLTKVLVAVFFYGLIIELNLNLCIALSIDLSSPTHDIDLKQGRLPSRSEHNIELDVRETSDDQARAMNASFASRSLASTTTTLETTTTTTTTTGKYINNLLVFPKDGSNQPKPSEQQQQQQQQQQPWSPATSSKPTPRALVQRLESNGRLNYFGKILVGEKQTPFLVLFDLSSTSSWLPSSECQMDLCLGRQKYNKSESSTYRADARSMEARHSNGLILSGPISRDSLTIAGVTIPNQAFGELHKLEGHLLATMPIDGFLGLGFRELRLASKNETGVAAADFDASSEPPMMPIERLWSMGLLREPIFSLKIKADIQSYMYSADNGELILGEISPEYAPEDFTYVPVSHHDQWEFHLKGVSLRSTYAALDLEQACQSECPAVLDTRYAFMAGHFSDVDRINKALGGFPIGHGIYRLSQCDLGIMPYLVFNIGDSEFLLSPDEYVDVRRIRGATHSCYLALVVIQSDDYPFWILGEYFLKRHYVVFDYGQKRIGFARSKSMTEELVEDAYGRIKKVRGTMMIGDAL